MLFASLFACFAAPPDPAPAAPSEETVPAAPIGTAYRSSTWCLEVHDDGGIVLSDRSPETPKIAIYGRLIEKRSEASVDTFRFEVTRIHRSRWISRCRKEVLGDQDLESHEMGGQAFTPGATVEVRLESEGDVKKLCLVYACAVVEPEPLLPPEKVEEKQRIPG